MRVISIAALLVLSLEWSSCFSSDNEERQSQKDTPPPADSDRVESQQRDSLFLLQKTYVHAITDFINSVKHKDSLSFDTLFVANRKSGLP
jgi:hypothetical protein